MIDLGSNSFRLVVFMAWEGWWRRTDEIYEPVRIGEGLAASGRLGEEPMRRALATLDVFDHFCRAGGLSGRAVDAVATSAIRDAENAAGFLALARERSGLPIRVLSREQEARYGYLAAVNSTTLTEGCVLDLGGGSLQLVRVVDRLAHELGSWRLGAVRMTERFLPANGPAKRRQMEQLREHVADELRTRRVARRRAGPRDGRHRRDGPQPRRRGPARVGTALQRGAGDDRLERGAGRARGAPRRAAGIAAQLGAGHQAGARRPDPGRCDRRAGRLLAGGRSTAWRSPRRDYARACSSSDCSPTGTRHCSPNCVARAC